MNHQHKPFRDEKKKILNTVREFEINELDFISGCPVQECINKNKLYRWIHENCGGRMKINNEGMVRCLKCAERAKFVYWPFTCGDHDFKECSVQGVAHSMVLSIAAAGEKSQQKFIITMTGKLMEDILNVYEKKGYIKGGGGAISEEIEFNNLDGEEFQQEITEVFFIAACPVQDCINKNKCYTWLHDKCGGRLKLNDKGMLRCLNCRTQGPFVDWPFNCGDHEDKECSTQGTAHCLVVMSELAVDNRGQMFVAKVAQCIMSQFTDKKREGRVIKGSAISEEYKTKLQEQSKNKSKEEVLEFDLISPCPVQECVTRNTLYKWKHKKCSGKLTLNVKGMVRCHECGTQVKYVDWPFNCGAHNGKKTCSLVGATHALEVTSGLEANKNHKELIKKALQVIMNDMFEETKIEAIGEEVS